jgi:hypothetical protein
MSPRLLVQQLLQLLLPNKYEYGMMQIVHLNIK